MSKIIKSSYASPESNGSKTIAIKKINLSDTNEGLFPDGEPDTSNGDHPDFQTEEQARQLIEQAEQQAQLIIQQAENAANQGRDEIELERQHVYNELEQLKEQTRQQGYEDGFQQGLEAGELQYRETIEQAIQIIEASKKDYHEVIEQAQPTIIDLAFTISQKIIGNAVRNEEEAWLTLVKEAILEVRDQDEVKVYVHPDWYERTLYHKSELLSLLSHTEQLFIYPDLQLQENGCVIETSYGRIDASMDSQLTELKHLLHEKLKEGKHGST
ncbi:flagellar assembly protein FliH [Alkalihalobacterium alkalinitrilicum]|uniref:flagellar assembly protein FliH n=1 Tax=Alkalihalobacterium alkalinitrilicum TaxID=427920 RepID=UPI001303A402|nr:flagellar assembly protein FliH [Alkalihalobacterium alkalinitrilicum]